MSQEIPFRIFKITNDPIELHADLYDEQSPMEFGTEFSFNGDLKQRIIGCRSVYMFRQGATMLSSLTVYCYFEVAPEYVNDNLVDGKVVVDKEFLRYLATLSVGTARGIQHAKTQGTVMNDYVIPPVNLMEIEFREMELKGKENGVE